MVPASWQREIIRIYKIQVLPVYSFYIKSSCKAREVTGRMALPCSHSGQEWGWEGKDRHLHFTDEETERL